MKKYYPIMYDIHDKKVVVIGGGTIAYRKVSSLLSYGAKVTVVSPWLVQEIEELASAGEITVIQRKYINGDLRGATLAISATNDSNVNEQVVKEAKGSNISINVVDQPQLCDFIFPAVHEQGYLTLTASTHGKSPILARKIKEKWQGEFGVEYGNFVEILGELRNTLMSTVESATLRKELLEQITSLEYIHRLQEEEKQVYLEMKEILGL